MTDDKAMRDLVNSLSELTNNSRRLASLLDALDIDQLTILADASLRLRQAVEDRLL